jgi:hypothetical protein
MCYNGPREVYKDIHTERRAPTPAKIMLAGEKACHINIREQISDECTS